MNPENYRERTFAFRNFNINEVSGSSIRACLYISIFFCLYWHWPISIRLRNACFNITAIPKNISNFELSKNTAYAKESVIIGEERFVPFVRKLYGIGNVLIFLGMLVELS